MKLRCIDNTGRTHPLTVGEVYEGEEGSPLYYRIYGRNYNRWRFEVVQEPATVEVNAEALQALLFLLEYLEKHGFNIDGLVKAARRRWPLPSAYAIVDPSMT